MSEGRRQVKLRDSRRGNWFWAQNELLDVFAPLIGADGVMVYMAMCRLVALNDGRVSIRELGEAACVSKSTAGRMKVLLVALGMIAEKRGKVKATAEFELLHLPDVAGVGREELERRASVPVRDSANRKLKMPAGKVDKVTVPVGDREVEDVPAKTAGTDLSQKRGNLSQKRAKKAALSILEKKRRQKIKTSPLPPASGGALRVRLQTGLDDGPPNSILRHGAARPTRASRRALVGAERGGGERAGLGLGLAASSAAVAMGVRRALAEVRGQIEDMQRLATVEVAGDLLEEWDAAFGGVEYESHEAMEGGCLEGIAVRVTSAAPQRTRLAVTRQYAARVEKALRSACGCRVALVVMGREAVAA